MLTELEMQNRKAAREDFIAAVWDSEESVTLLPLASAAGLTGNEADALIERIREARESLVHVNNLPHLRKEAADANSRYEKVYARASAEIGRLEKQIHEAAWESESALKAMSDADAQAQRLLALYDEGLLPAGETPKEVFRLMTRRQLEEQFRQADMARVAAENERNRRLAVVQSIESRLANMPITRTTELDEKVLRDRLKEARRQLSDAESRMEKAEAAAVNARKAIS